jgi:hypothetical protein
MNYSYRNVLENIKYLQFLLVRSTADLTEPKVLFFLLHFLRCIFQISRSTKRGKTETY